MSTTGSVIVFGGSAYFTCTFSVLYQVEKRFNHRITPEFPMFDVLCGVLLSRPYLAKIPFSV